MKYNVHIIIIFILLAMEFQETIKKIQRSLRVGEESKGRWKVKGLMG